MGLRLWHIVLAAALFSSASGIHLGAIKLPDSLQNSLNNAKQTIAKAFNNGNFNTSDITKQVQEFLQKLQKSPSSQ